MSARRVLARRSKGAARYSVGVHYVGFRIPRSDRTVRTVVDTIAHYLPPEHLLTRQVLKRRPVTPAAELPSERLRLARRQALGARVQRRAIRPQDGSQEDLGVRPWALDAMPLEIAGGAGDHFGRPHLNAPGFGPPAA